ncbi:hypothetical protein F8M41_004552 [Gigaspora margarita]|uniref:Uncharacterized protein n=1 Tax=Gigaspora margarita TaxID=4874 RepID=A0A8H3XBJ4_GIGMA|nr:hypothetical protein F8M41_004552 [Gigaspora margarita]
MEEKINNNFNFTNEKTFKEDTIKGAARILIKKSIYPTEDQIKSKVENYLLEKIRALRDTLTTKIKLFIFFVFGNFLEPINNHASSKMNILKHNTEFSLSSSEDETEKEKSNKESDNVEKTYKRPRVETSEEEQEDQKKSLEDLKEAEQEPEDNDSNNVKKIYKRPRVETSEIEWDNQDDLSDDSKETKNELKNNDSKASSSSFSDNDNDSKKETDDDSK